METVPTQAPAWKLSDCAFYELNMRKAHVPGEFNDTPVFDNDQKGLPVGKFNWFHVSHICLTELSHAGVMMSTANAE